MTRSRPSNRFVTLMAALAAAATVAACAAELPTASAPPRENPETSLFGRRLDQLALLSCAVLPADSASQVIGPAGGVIEVGPHRFTVPAGALDRDVTITAIVPADTIDRVRLFPEGLRFATPATLTMSYAHCGTLTWLLPRRIVHIDEGLHILEVLPSLNDFLGRNVSARLSHFSDYAVAW